MNPSIDPPRTILGIDMARATFSAHLILPSGKTHAHDFTNDPPGLKALDSWLHKHHTTAHPLHAGIEATGTYALPLLLHLHTAGHHTSQLNPRRVKDFTRSLGRRVKTDPSDARDIALFVQHLRPDPWSPPPTELAQLQALMRHRHDLVTQSVATRNRLKTAQTTLVAESLTRQVKALTAELTLINHQIDALVLDHLPVQRDHRLLTTIPGIGRIGAATLLGEVPHLHSFTRARHLAAFTGVTPTPAQSGTSVRRRGAMSKEGSALLRQALYMAALNVIKRPNPLRPFYERLLASGKSKACALGALMHKLIRIAYGVLKHQTPFSDILAHA